MNRNAAAPEAGQIFGTLNGQQVFGLDIAKQVFQLHSMNMGTGEIINIQLKRAKVIKYFANKAPCVIAMEACGGAHHWARELGQFCHTVRLLHAKFVRPFVPRNKTDAADARAIRTAVQQPGIKTVGIKSTGQQATLALHRQRELLMKTRIMQTNALRGLLYEFGVTFAKGRKALFSGVQAKIEGLSGQLPQMVRDSLSEQVGHIKAIERNMLAIETHLALCLKADPAMQRVAQIPGVGVLCATAAIATMGPAQAYQSGREFCAWLGMVPAQNGTGGKTRLGGNSQARRHLSAHAADTRGQERAVPRQAARPMAGCDQTAQAGQCGRRRASGQDGANDMGADGQGAGLPAGPPQRQARRRSAGQLRQAVQLSNPVIGLPKDMVSL